jgi:hypothetical protein
MDFDFTTETIKPDNTGLITIGGTQGVEIPAGTTAQRPSTALVAGTLRFNSSTPGLEYYNGAAWIIDGTVTSVAMTVPSFLSVTGSPITTSGTLALTLSNQSANTVLAGPTTGAATTPTFRTLSLAGNDLTDVLITSPTNGQTLSWNGTGWVNTGQAAGSYSVLVSSWTLVSGTKYSAVVTHNLGTQNVVVQAYNASTNALIYLDTIVATSAAAITIYVNGGTPAYSVRVIVIANGQSIAAGGSTPSSIIVQNNGVALSGTYTTVNLVGSLVATGAAGVATVTDNLSTLTLQVNGVTLTGGPFTTINFTGSTITGSGSGGVATISDSLPTIRTLTYFATSLDSPNNSDWTVNALAPTVTDPTNAAIDVRQFSSTSEQGVGLFVPIPSTATNIVFTYKGRAQTAPGTASTLTMKLYTRALQQATPAAIPAWSAATTLTAQTVPTNAFYQNYSYTASLASLSLVAGNLYQFEFTRAIGGVTGNWLMVQLDISFT